MTKPERVPKPLQYAGAYTLHLYCDCWISGPHHGVYGSFPHEFSGKDFADCAKQASARGWKIHIMECTATCPKCVKLGA